MTLVRRLHLVTDFHSQIEIKADFKELSHIAETIESQKEMSWQEGMRYSNRQKQTIPLGGLIGKWYISGNLTPFIPYLYIGQWLHIGKATTFGLGKYILEFE